MKATILWLMLLVPSALFAKETYWKVEKIKPIVQTSLFFEVLVTQQLTDLDHFMYDEENKTLWYYDSYTMNMKPQPIGQSFMESEDSQPSKESRVEARIVGGKLKILIYQNNANIAFIICKKVSDDQTAFLKAVEAEKKKVADNKMAGLKAHPAVTLPASNSTNAVKVGLDGFAISLPADTYFILPEQNGSYKIINKKQKEPTAAFEIYKAAHSGNDSLVNRELYPILKEGSFWVNTAPYYDWTTKEKGTQGYMFSNSLQTSNGFINMQTGEVEKLEELHPYIPVFRSMTTDLSGAMSIESYNNAAGSSKVKEKTVTAGTQQIKLPNNYEFRQFENWGGNMYQFDVTAELRFSNEDPDSRYYHVRDTAAQGSGAANGGLYSLKKSGLKIDMPTIREVYEEEGAKIMAQDASGLVCYYRGDYTILRYTQRGDTHYVYLLQLPDLPACLQEFGRSANMFL